MSNLATYNGNFLTFADEESRKFDPSVDKSFCGISELDLDLSCSAIVLPSLKSKTTIEIDTDDASQFSISQKGDCLSVKQKNAKGSGVTFNQAGGSTVISSCSGNMSIVNGVVYVNGVQVDSSAQNSHQVKPSRVRIYAAHGIRLSAQLSGSSVFASKVVFNKAYVKVSGQSTIGFAAKGLNLKLSGQGESFVAMKGGDLKVKLSGQGSIRIKGEWDESDVSVSGMGGIKTEGNCQGDYDANVSGMGSISHSGLIQGRVRKSVSGMGSVNIQ